MSLEIISSPMLLAMKAWYCDPECDLSFTDKGELLRICRGVRIRPELASIGMNEKTCECRPGSSIQSGKEHFRLMDRKPCRGGRRWHD